MQSSGGESEAAESADLDPESVDSLLKYLIYIVLDNEKSDTASADKAEQAKKSILDLLKTDEALRN